MFNGDLYQDFFDMTRRGNASMVRDLLSRGADVNARTVAGMTALHQAASFGHWEVIEELLNHPNVNVNARADDLKAPLHLAAQKGKERSVILLLGKGADVSLADNDGWTPLHYAAVGGKKDIIQLLLNKGADFNAKDKQGRTPCDIAREKPMTPGRELLLDARDEFQRLKRLQEGQKNNARNIDRLKKILPPRRKK